LEEPTPGEWFAAGVHERSLVTSRRSGRKAGGGFAISGQRWFGAWFEGDALGYDGTGPSAWSFIKRIASKKGPDSIPCTSDDIRFGQ